MDTTLILAITTITLALIFYTIGVFAERRSNTLKPWHVLLFWLGLICDSTGTYIMSTISKNNPNIPNTTATLHGITGILAILLMIFHAVWATWVLIKNEESKKIAFHKFSLTVWLIWLIPYVIGMIIGMMG